MSRRYDVSDPSQRADGIAAAVSSAQRGALVVVPTESSYGLGTDAFRPDGVERLRSVKGAGPHVPLPVLVGYPSTVQGLLRGLSADAHRLIEAFWPGPLTLIGSVQPSLIWDVSREEMLAVRMPLHPVALDIARGVGPFVLTGANVAGADPARTCESAQSQFGDNVDVYLDAGESPESVPSTVVDITVDPPRLLRVGQLDLVALAAVCPGIIPA